MTLNTVLHFMTLLSLLFYCGVLLCLIVGLRRVKFSRSDRKPFVSVIVAARNEEQTVGRLLEGLTRQSYRSYEIIVVNDRSTDRTAEVISAFEKQHRNLRLVSVGPQSEMPAKKFALTKGIEVSRGEILCFTDADCIVPERWLEYLVASFEDNVGLVAGYSPYDSTLKQSPGRAGFLKTLLVAFIEYEEFKGAAWAAGSIGLRRGWLCTGRSLAYRRSVFEEVHGFELIKNSVSGDDDLFLQLVRKNTKWKIRYLTSPESQVRTAPENTVRGFLRQRVRHFSAGRAFSPLLKLFFLLVHGANLCLFTAFILSLVSSNYSFGLWTFDVKILADFALFAVAASTFRQWKFAASFLLMEILYILYNTLVGPLGFFGRVGWKQELNRILEPSVSRNQ